MINAKLQSIIDTKSAIGNAIVNKGGTITGETPFFNYAAQIDGISTGTPETIFQASDGSKWALTNAVNLVNSAGNVTSDFNYWQPANNSTSDPILNIGTVGANISGNIQLVPVNQVNIAQYVNIVINDTDGAKYEGYNGYDSQTNPTPTGNTTFNLWLLNNSATGTIIFANTSVTNGGTFNGPNTSINEASMSFVGNTANYGWDIETVKVNNGFIYVGGSQINRNVRKYYESNLAFDSNSVSYGADIRSIAINNGFIYVGGSELSGTNRGVSKFHESNLVRIGNTVNYGSFILSVVTNNGFVYAGGGGTNTIRKHHEGNLVFVSNSPDYGGLITNLKTNNSFIYAVGFTNQTIQKFHESNLVRDSNSGTYGGSVRSIAINNGFIFISGDTNQTVQKFYESNLAFVGNTNSYGGRIQGLTTNNGFIYAGGTTAHTVKKFEESSLSFEQFTFYTATKIKE
jgi:signal peptidase I